MIDAIASYEGRIAKVHGPARSGKTEALVKRCAYLLRAGTDPHSVLVEVTSGFAAQAFRQRLRAALGDERGDAANAVRVTTTLDVCADVLDAPDARAATGRIPRLLTAAEYRIVLEDMKTLGTPVRRLRALLERFFACMDEGLPLSDWHLDGEEEAVRAHLERVVSSRCAMLAQEAPALCAAYLREARRAERGVGFAYVLCDDFQNLSRAEQTCLCLLATEQLIVAGNEEQAQVTQAAHPYVAGFTQFEAERREVAVFELAKPFDHPVANALASDDTMVVKWSTPEEEVNGITKLLRVLLDEDDAAPEQRTCVVVPTKRWAVLLEQALRQRGFAVSAAGAQGGIGGDPRERSRARELEAYTKLNLLADPRDLVAWRTWCGFDNYLTNSDAWNALLAFADEAGQSLYDALLALAERDDEPFLRAAVLRERFLEGRAFIERNAGRTGFNLLSAIGAEGLPAFEDIARAMAGDESAAQLFALVRAQEFHPAFPDDAHTLRIATFATLAGTAYDNLFVVAAVNGFIPRRDAFEVISTEEARERVMSSERRSFASGIAKAEKRLVISYFTKAPLEVAERTKMQVTRVRAEQGERIALVQPTVFLAEAGNACPATTGGQTLLAAHGLN